MIRSWLSRVCLLVGKNPRTRKSPTAQKRVGRRGPRPCIGIREGGILMSWQGREGAATQGRYPTKVYNYSLYMCAIRFCMAATQGYTPAPSKLLVCLFCTHAMNNTTRTSRHKITYKAMVELGTTYRSYRKLHKVNKSYDKLQELQEVAEIVVIGVSNS